MLIPADTRRLRIDCGEEMEKQEGLTLSNAVEHARGCVATNMGLLDMVSLVSLVSYITSDD